MANGSLSAFRLGIAKRYIGLPKRRKSWIFQKETDKTSQTLKTQVEELALRWADAAVPSHTQQLEHGEPDLRNLSVYSQVCDDLDFIILCSDGVHDNLDPQTLGKSPRELGLESTDGTWEGVTNIKLGEEMKAKWTARIVQEMIEKALADRTEMPTFLIAKALVEHAKKLTRPSREFMENHPSICIVSNVLILPFSQIRGFQMIIRFTLVRWTTQQHLSFKWARKQKKRIFFASLSREPSACK